MSLLDSTKQLSLPRAARPDVHPWTVVFMASVGFFLLFLYATGIPVAPQN